MLVFLGNHWKCAQKLSKIVKNQLQNINIMLLSTKDYYLLKILSIFLSSV